jgi:hypothetical protein
MKVMAKRTLGALLAMALVCNANAKPEKRKDKNNGGIVDAEPRKDKDGIVYSVPDGGSSLALLAISVLLLLSQRGLQNSVIVDPSASRN